MNFKFFADKTDILIKNFSSNLGPINIENGDAKIQVSPEILVETNFLSNIKIGFLPKISGGKQIFASPFQ